MLHRFQVLDGEISFKVEGADLWSKEFGGSFKPEDIKCDGCISTGERIVNYCRICEIRKCGQGKKVQNCAYCAEYPCEKLNGFFKMVPDAQKILDEVRRSLHYYQKTRYRISYRNPFY